MRIFIVRHGQTKWNLEKRAQYDKPVPLNKTGKTQASILAQNFKNVHLTHIYASPTVRTMQTARIIAKFHRLKVIAGISFIERNPGELVSLSETEIRQRIPDLEQQRVKNGIDWRPPGKGGETIRELQKRVNLAFKNLLKKHNKDDVILLVTHAATIKSIVHNVHDGKPEDFFHAKAFENAEIVEIECDGKQCKVLDKSL